MNINEPVWLKLTPEGNKVFDAYHTDLKQDPAPFRSYAEVGNGWLKLQMWELMAIFGPATFMGGANLIIDNEIMLSEPADAVVDQAASASPSP